jgi:hypothetical protein
MKKSATILLTLMVLGAFVLGQTRVDNPKRPLSKNAGRAIELEEVLRIRDDGNSAIFRNPQWLSKGEEGSLLFMDSAEGSSLYCYSPEGSFIFRILKDGQGPGECNEPSGYIYAGDTIRVAAWMPPKIMDFSPNGRFIKEAKVEEDMHGLWFLGTANGKVYGIRNELFSSAAFRSTGTLSIPNSVYEISPDFKTWKKVYEFPVRMVIEKGRAVYLDMVDAAIQGPILYIVHSAEYRIVKFDLRNARVDRIITRVYKRVKAMPEKGADPTPEARRNDPSSTPYIFDIKEIHAVGENLWVLTSFMKPDGNTEQVDVFNAAGRFIDSFFLHFPRSGRIRRGEGIKSLITDDNYLFIPEQEEDGLVTIGKYKIRNLSVERD